MSQLSGLIRRALDSEVGRVWLEAEISSATQAQSGHVYLTLKDDKAQIRGIIWRSTLERLNLEVEVGQKVLCCGQVEVYPPRGEYQIVIDRIEQTGLGELQRAFRKLHERLTKEGLFSAEFKKHLPQIPRHIVLITSPAGAAVIDFLKVLLDRWPEIRVTLIPVAVQGPEAKTEIAKAIIAANRLNDAIDLLVVTRGGGSLEDLWAFNEEVVVRAVFESAIPVVSAVGHEIDITLCDLVADFRAATPTDAAEKIIPQKRQVVQALNELGHRLMSGLSNVSQAKREKLELLARNPVLREPFRYLSQMESQCDGCWERLRLLSNQKLEQNRNALQQLSRNLEAVSPLAVLERGYSLTTNEKSQVLKKAKDVEVGEVITTRLHEAVVISMVTEVKPTSQKMDTVTDRPDNS